MPKSMTTAVNLATVEPRSEALSGEVSPTERRSSATPARGFNAGRVSAGHRRSDRERRVCGQDALARARVGLINASDAVISIRLRLDRLQRVQPPEDDHELGVSMNVLGLRTSVRFRIG